MNTYRNVLEQREQQLQELKEWELVAQIESREDIEEELEDIGYIVAERVG